MKEVTVNEYESFGGKIFKTKIDRFNHEFLEKFKKEVADKITNYVQEQTLHVIGLPIISEDECSVEMLRAKLKLLFEDSQNEPN